MKFFVFLIAVGICHTAKLPDYFPKCKKGNGNEFNECLTKSANAAWPTMVNGDNTYHIQKLNPFVVPFMQITVSDNLTGNLSSVSITGLEDLHFDEIKLDLNKKSLDIKFTIPRMNLVSNYEVTGKLLVTPIEGKGPANITFLNMINNLHIEYNLQQKADKKNIEITKTELKYTTTRGYFRMDNLFGGDEKLGAAMNKVLDEQWEAVNEEVGRTFGDVLGLSYSTMLQAFFRKVSIEEIFE